MRLIKSDGESLITPEAIAVEFAAPAQSADYASSVAAGKLALILNIALDRVASGRHPDAIFDYVTSELHRLRRRVEPRIWRSLVPVIQDHRLMDYFLEDPLTRWSFNKPRGYSGDAQLLDFIYGHPNRQDDIKSASRLGRAIYAKTSQSQSAHAVRERRDLLTTYVDTMAASHAGSTEVLAIAAGHLREANGSNALRYGAIQRWVALDQDPLSVGSMVRDFRGTRVDPIDGSVKGLLTQSYNLGSFDFIYAAGLYDYLPRSVAIKLTRRCMSMLKQNGTFLFANFAEGMEEDAYMETVMNWSLLLRSEADMWDIVNACVDRNAVNARVFHGENGYVHYGVIEKRG